MSSKPIYIAKGKGPSYMHRLPCLRGALHVVLSTATWNGFSSCHNWTSGIYMWLYVQVGLKSNECVYQSTFELVVRRVPDFGTQASPSHLANLEKTRTRVWVPTNEKWLVAPQNRLFSSQTWLFGFFGIQRLEMSLTRCQSSNLRC